MEEKNIHEWWQPLSSDITKNGGLLDKAIEYNLSHQDFYAGHKFSPDYKQTFIDTYNKGKEMLENDKFVEWWNGNSDTGEPGFKDILGQALVLAHPIFIGEAGIVNPSTIDPNSDTESKENHSDSLPINDTLFKQLHEYKGNPEKAQERVDIPTASNEEKRLELNELLKALPEDTREAILATAKDIKEAYPEMIDDDAKFAGILADIILEIKDETGISNEEIIDRFQTMLEGREWSPDLEKGQAQNVEQQQFERAAENTVKDESVSDKTDSATSGRGDSTKYGVEGKISDNLMLSNIDRIYENIKCRFDKDGNPKKDIEAKMGKAELIAREERWRITASDILKDSSTSNEQKYDKLANAFKENFINIKEPATKNRELFRGVWNRLDAMGKNPSTNKLNDFKDYMSRAEVKDAFTQAVKENDNDVDAEKKVDEFYDKIERAAEESSPDNIGDVVNDIRIDYDEITKNTDGDIAKRPLSDVDYQKGLYLERAEEWKERKEELSHGYKKSTFKAIAHYREVVNRFKAATGDEKKALIGEVLGAAFEVYNSDIINTIIFSAVEGLMGFVVSVLDKNEIAGKKECIDTIDKVSKAIHSEANDVEKHKVYDISKDGNEADGKITKNETAKSDKEESRVEGVNKEVTADEKKSDIEAKPGDTPTAGEVSEGKVSQDGEKFEPSAREEAAVQGAAQDSKDLKEKLTTELKETFNDYASKVETSAEQGGDQVDTRPLSIDVNNIVNDGKYSGLSDTEKAECMKEAVESVKETSPDAYDTLEKMYVSEDSVPDGKVSAEEQAGEKVETPEEPLSDAPTTVGEEAEHNPTINEQDPVVARDGQPAADHAVAQTTTPEGSEKKEGETEAQQEEIAVAMADSDSPVEVDQHSEADMDKALENMEDKIKSFFEDRGKPTGDQETESVDTATSLTEMANEYGDNAKEMVMTAFQNAIDSYNSEHPDNPVSQDTVTELKEAINNVDDSFHDTFPEVSTPTDTGTEDGAITVENSPVSFSLDDTPITVEYNSGTFTDYSEQPADFETAYSNVADVVMNGDTGMISVVEDTVHDVSQEEEPKERVDYDSGNNDTEMPQHEFGNFETGEPQNTGVEPQGDVVETIPQPVEAGTTGGEEVVGAFDL